MQVHERPISVPLHVMLRLSQPNTQAQSNMNQLSQRWHDRLSFQLFFLPKWFHAVISGALIVYYTANRTPPSLAEIIPRHGISILMRQVVMVALSFLCLSSQYPFWTFIGANPPHPLLGCSTSCEQRFQCNICRVPEIPFVA